VATRSVQPGASNRDIVTRKEFDQRFTPEQEEDGISLAASDVAKIIERRNSKNVHYKPFGAQANKIISQSVYKEGLEEKKAASTDRLPEPKATFYSQGAQKKK